MSPHVFFCVLMIHLPQQRRPRSKSPRDQYIRKRILWLNLAFRQHQTPAKPPKGFFDRVREAVGETIFSRSLAIRTPPEWSRLAILDGSDISLNEREGIDFYKLKPDELRDLSTRGQGRPIIILVEDITVDCVERLDAAFGLDPLFLLAYERGVSASQNDLPDGFQDLANRLREADDIFFDNGAVWTIRTRDLSPGPTTFSESGNVSRSVSRRWIAACSWSVPKTHLVLVTSGVRMRARPLELSRCMDGGRNTGYIAPPPLPHILCIPPKGFYDLFVELCASNGEDINGRVPKLSDVVFGLLPDRFQQADVCEERFSTLPQLLAVLAYDSGILQLRVDWDELRYEAILSPSIRSFQSLIGLRRQITDIHRDLNPDLLRAEVPKPAKRFIGMGTGRGFDLVGLSRRLDACSVHHRHTHAIPDWVTRLAQETEKMEDDLNDDIQLAIGAATILDSDSMRQQAERGTLLTTLAAVYLPLTLVTGIFGMNIREISRGDPRFWWCLVILVVIGLATIVLVLGYKNWTRFRTSEERESRRDDLTRIGMLVPEPRDDFYPVKCRISKARHIIEFFRWLRKA